MKHYEHIYLKYKFLMVMNPHVSLSVGWSGGHGSYTSMLLSGHLISDTNETGFLKKHNEMVTLKDVQTFCDLVKETLLFFFYI